MTNKNFPQPQRPYPLEGYGIPEHEDNLIAWEYVIQRLHEAHEYWVATIHPQGWPHVRPVWGVVVEKTLFVGGGPQTRWSRNLKENPSVSINLENGTRAIVIEGTADYITDDPALISKTDSAYVAKYGIEHGPVWRIIPRKIFAWDTMDTMTRWVFI